MGACEGLQLHFWTTQRSITCEPGPRRRWLAPSISGCPAMGLRPKTGRRQRLPKRRKTTASSNGEERLPRTPRLWPSAGARARMGLSRPRWAPWRRGATRAATTSLVLAESRSTSRQKTIFHKFIMNHILSRLSDSFTAVPSYSIGRYQLGRSCTCIVL